MSVIAPLLLLALLLTAKAAHAERPPDTSGWTQVPGALAHPSCVHEIPRGVTVRGLDLYGPDGRYVSSLPACEYPVLWSSRGDGRTAADGALEDAPLASGHAWIADLTLANQNGTVFNYISDSWAVPDYPADPTGQLIYLFDSFKNADNSAILQPVLQYGESSFFGGEEWEIADWFVSSAVITHSPPFQVYPGDNIVGSIWMSGATQYTVQWDDTTQGIYWYLDVNLTGVSAGLQFTTAQPGVLEVYGVTSCAQYPSGTSGVTLFGDVYMAEECRSGDWSCQTRVGAGTTGWQSGIDTQYPTQCSYVAEAISFSGQDFAWLGY